MYCSYGSFNFEPWECSLGSQVSFEKSARGYKTFHNLVYTFDIEVVGQDESSVGSRVNTIFNAFMYDGRSCGLKYDSGAESPQWMPNHSQDPRNVTDVQVIGHSSPQSINGEGVTGKKFNFTVASMYFMAPTNILDYSETIARTGNGGAEYDWVKNPIWGHHPILKSPTSIQEFVQEGHAIGAIGYPLPNPPLYPAPFEMLHQRQVRHISPRHYPKGRVHYTVTWKYVYRLPGFDDITMPRVLPIL
jgi:hypothetical protein